VKVLQDLSKVTMCADNTLLKIFTTISRKNFYSEINQNISVYRQPELLLQHFDGALAPGR
jgi:hypothetical protein